MSVRDGGSAFPTYTLKFDVDNNMHVRDDGMTLRDYFASKAMQGMMADSNLKANPMEFSMLAYAVADAMLKARETQR
jgi:hypothetical protein